MLLVEVKNIHDVYEGVLMTFMLGKIPGSKLCQCLAMQQRFDHPCCSSKNDLKRTEHK